MTPPKVLPPHYFFLALTTMLIPGYLGERILLPGMWYLIGIVPIALGVVIVAVAARQFSKADTNIVPFTKSTTLVTGGVFAFTRNPMYVSMVMALAGTALLLNTPLPWLVVAAFWVIIQFGFVRHEEILMTETFGESYLSYQARVRRWL